MVKPTKITAKPQVSSLGRYRNHLGVISTRKPRTNGYVAIKINGKLCLMHRVMAVAFDLPRRDDQDTVDHINGNPSNNLLDNLRWASRSEQIRHSYATNKTRGSSAPKLSKPILGRPFLRVAVGVRSGRASTSSSGRRRTRWPCCQGKFGGMWSFR
jgi:hypothetical protein